MKEQVERGVGGYHQEAGGIKALHKIVAVPGV